MVRDDLPMEDLFTQKRKEEIQFWVKIILFLIFDTTPSIEIH